MRSLLHEMLLAKSRERMSETYIAGHSSRSAFTVATLVLLLVLGCIGAAQTDAEGGNLAVVHHLSGKRGRSTGADA
jgi:hypothetical protein